MSEPTAEILVVDDDDVVRGMLGYIFDESGFAVREAVDGAQAIAALEEHEPDCMVLDLMMPDIDGFGVLRAMRDRGLGAATRVVVLTAKTETQDALWCWELGADEFLNKPFEPDRLVHVVHELVSLSPDEASARRAAGLAEARRLDEMEAAFGRRPKAGQ